MTDEPNLRLKGLPFESVGFKQREIAKNGAARPVGDDSAGVEQDCAGTQLEHKLEVMGGDQLGAWQAIDKLNQPPATARVEVGGRFIGAVASTEGIAGQHSCDTNIAAGLAEAQGDAGGRSASPRSSTRSRQSSAIRRASAAFLPRLSGPNATSSMTVLQKS